MTKFEIGDRVVCDWGSGGRGYVKKGVVVSNAKYNGYMTFNPDCSEDACVIRFDVGEKSWNNEPLGKNEVVPVRQIRKA